jgi:hypothetical protein
VHLKLLTRTYYGTDAGFAFQRTPDGNLHLVYPTRGATGGNTGLASLTISAAGSVGPQAQAVSNLSLSRPGLVAQPGGALTAVFGALPAPPTPNGIYAVTSTNGGATWTAPGMVGSGSTLEALDYSADVTARLLGTTPWLTLNVAGGITLQQGLGAGAPTSAVSTPPSFDGSTSNVESAVDAATGELVLGWYSIATPGGDFMQGVAPAVQAAKKVPPQIHNAIVVAARDKGAGVFAAYTPDNVHVRLYRYAGGSVALGNVKNLTPKVVGVATGLDGRIWVMWGDDSLREVAITRSNKAVTRFEPIQVVKDDAFDIWGFRGDGRLGPLDLFVTQTPIKPTVEGTYYARVYPELSAGVSVHAVKNKKGKTTAFKLTVTVTDAGDAVSGATVAAGSKKKSKTNNSGVAKLTLPASTAPKVTLSVTDTGYNALSVKVNL